MFDANQVAAIESAMEEERRKDREALQRLKRFLPVERLQWPRSNHRNRPLRRL